MTVPVRVATCVLVVAVSAVIAYATREEALQFAIVGDRTGEAVAGVYEQVWRNTAADHPRFVITVGDSIQGGSDLTVDSEWREVVKLLAPFRNVQIFFTPGNHDVWSVPSAQAYEKYTKRPLHYSFDFGEAHLVVLDNSRSDELPAEELAFLQKDLDLHSKQHVNFIVSHRPSWVLKALLRNPEFPLQQIAESHDVHYVIAGHLHEMLHVDLDGVTYVSVPSAGGHLRASRKYDDGWFFGHVMVTIRGSSADFLIKETGPPFGQSRVTHLNDWGAAGLRQSKDAR